MKLLLLGIDSTDEGGSDNEIIASNSVFDDSFSLKVEAKKWKLIYKRVRLSSDVLEDFKDKDIARLWYEGKRVKRMPPYLELLDILQILNNDIKHPLELRNLLPSLLIIFSLNI